MADEVKPQGQKFAPRDRARFVVEITGGKQCRNVRWPMTKETLRSRWSRDTLVGISCRSALASIPDIPGLLIEIDVTRKLARILDPLASDANLRLAGIPGHAKELVDHINVYYPALSENGQAGKPENDREYNLDETGVKSWLYWVRRLLDGNKVVLKQGESFPTLEEIAALPGKTACSQWSSNWFTPKFKEDAAAWEAKQRERVYA